MCLKDGSRWLSLYGNEEALFSRASHCQGRSFFQAESGNIIVMLHSDFYIMLNIIMTFLLSDSEIVAYRDGNTLTYPTVRHNKYELLVLIKKVWENNGLLEITLMWAFLMIIPFDLAFIRKSCPNMGQQGYQQGGELSVSVVHLEQLRGGQ